MVAAAVLLPEKFRHRRLNDSKQLTPERREEIYEELVASVVWAVGVIDALEIDQVNILQATHRAMRSAISALSSAADHALIDGRPVLPFPLPQTAVIDGDCYSLSIAAASVIAKVTRDRLMREFCARFPEYCFSQHKGYGTLLHLRRLQEFGPCPIHRRSFEPVAQPRFAFALASAEEATRDRTDAFSDTGSLGRDFKMNSEWRRSLSRWFQSWSQRFQLRRAPHLRRGARGETLACRHLRRHGYKVLYRNFRGRTGGEIDIVCRDGDTLVFVEVKSRASEDFGRPFETIRADQRQRISRGALAWLRLLDNPDITFRFDVVEVVFDAKQPRLELIQNAFGLSEPLRY